MGPLTALVLATPIFGLSLSLPQLEAMPLSSTPVAQFNARLVTEDDFDEDAQNEVAEVQEGELEATERAELEAEARKDAEPARDQSTYMDQLRKRAKLAKIHRTLGITTWALTGLAVISGTIQWRNMYKGGIGSNPCVTGDAWFGQGQCQGFPWFHGLTAFSAGAAYFSTLGLAIAMPDPDNASKGDSQYARNIRMHKILRWVHLSGMVAQMVLGIVIANPKLSGGLDRANDYEKMKTFSLVHLGVGYVTFGALSWAGWLLL
jgi:cytochrome b561